MTFAPKHAVYILLFWFGVNLLFLDRFPFVHSDEIWLGGLTRAMMQGGTFDVTEPFFALQPRNPHALKVLFHAAQFLSLHVFGFTVFGLRFFSLVCGVIGLWLFYRLLRATGMTPGVSIAGMVMLSLDSQYLYASHFGRQEMPVVVFMLAGLLLFFGKTRRPRFRAVCVGLCTGLALGVHPNAFVAAMPVSLLFVIEVIDRRRTMREGLFFAAAATFSAGMFIFSSFMMNSYFLSDYSDFGRSVGVRSGFAGRLADFPRFFVKLFERVSGTYYTPDIRPQLLLIFAALCIATGAPVLAVVRAVVVRAVVVSAAVWSPAKKGGWRDGRIYAEKAGAAGLFGTVAGIFILGKFSQPSILFLIPFLYLLLASVFSRCANGAGALRRARFPVAILCTLLSASSLRSVIIDTRQETEPYEELQENLAALVPQGTKTLGNLSWGISLGTENLLDIRDLAFLEPSGTSLPDYIEENKIECIVVSDELDFIYASRPVWNVMYGNPARWFPALRKFLEERCVLAGEFSSPGYGMRIVSRRYKRDWKVRVYRVADAEIVR